MIFFVVIGFFIYFLFGWLVWAVICWDLEWIHFKMHENHQSSLQLKCNLICCHMNRIGHLAVVFSFLFNIAWTLDPVSIIILFRLIAIYTRQPFEMMCEWLFIANFKVPLVCIVRSILIWNIPFAPRKKRVHFSNIWLHLLAIAYRRWWQFKKKMI